MADRTTEDLVTRAKTERIPFTANDSYRPVHPDGRTDLNLHMLDMTDEGDRESDPFSQPGSIPGEQAPKGTA